MKKIINTDLVFFGTPDFVVPVTNALLHIPNCQLSAVVTNPDRPVGRQAYRQAGKQILTPSPIKSWAQQNNLKVIDSTLMIHIIRVIKKLKPDLGILAAYGKIIPQEVINLFPKGILVIHPSLLPKYRGASPIQAAIFNGDQETGVSIIQMDEKMDHGPIVSQFKEIINPDDTAETLTKRLFAKTAPVLISLIMSEAKLIEDRSFIFDISRISFLRPIPQNHALATYTKLLTKDDGQIDWRWPPEKIERFVRAMTPWPSAWTFVTMKQSNNETIKQLRLKILKAHLEKEKLILNEVQLEGKIPVSFSEFQKGYPGAKLS